MTRPSEGEATTTAPRSRLSATRSAGVSVAAAVAFGLLFSMPLNIYLANVLEYSLDLLAVVRTLLLVSLLGFLVFLLPVLVLPLRASNWYTLGLLVIAVGGYVQGSFMVWDYGLLDGRELRWEGHTLHAGVEVVVWLVVAGVAVCGRRRLAPYMSQIAVALLAIQSVALGVAVASRRTPPPHHYYSLDQRELATFSPSKNIILVVLDELQSNTLPELLAAEPGLESSLQGFTFYPNAVSGYAKTMGSVPNLLTGTFYYNDRPISEHLTDSYRRSVLAALRRAGHKVEVYPWSDKVVVFDPTICSNVVPKFAAGIFPPEVAQLLDLALFRHLPHVAKPIAVGDPQWAVSALSKRWMTMAAESDIRTGRAPGLRPRDLEFYDRFVASHITDDPAPRFKFFHLQGPHEPFWLDADLSVGRLPVGEDGYRRQARASLRVLEKLLERLAETGALAHTDLLVVSDHGAGEYRIKPPGTGDASGIDPFVRASGLPLFMVRPAGATGAFDINNAPVALADIPATVADLAGLDPDDFGHSVLRARESDERVRFYYHYSFDGWDRRYLPPLHEYEVKGNSWDPQSWRATGRILEPGEVEISPEPGTKMTASAKGSASILQAGDTVTFGIGSTGLDYLGRGWNSAERGLTWSQGKRSELKIPLDVTTACQLKFDLQPYVSLPQRPSQRVGVSVGGRQVDAWQLTASGRYGIVISPLEDSQELTISFDLPDAVSPLVDLQVSQDSRVLGIGVRDLVVEPMPDFPADGILTFREGGSAVPFLLYGWGDPESNGIWTANQQVGFVVRLSRPGGATDVRCRVQPYIREGFRSHQRVEVLADGVAISSWDIDRPGEYTLTLPEKPQGDRSWVHLSFLLPDAARPIDNPRNPGTDVRELALRFTEVHVLSSE